MNWITHYNGTNWKIETNAAYYVSAYSTYYYFRFDKSFLKITMKTAGEKTIVIDNESYTFYSANEYILVEITDSIRSLFDGRITFTSGSFSETMDWVPILGASSEEFLHDLPKEIPFNPSSTLPFWICISKDMKTKTTRNTIRTYNAPASGSKSASYDWISEITINNVQLFLYDIDNNYTYLTNKSCWTDKILVEWISAFGFPKSWWFQVDGEIYGSDKTLNLQTMENGYYTLKNKRVSVRIKHTRADNTTQKYLSDIAMSDEVYVYEGLTKLRVRLADNAFEITQGKRDVQLLINKYAYDTI